MPGNWPAWFGPGAAGKGPAPRQAPRQRPIGVQAPRLPDHRTHPAQPRLPGHRRRPDHRPVPHPAGPAAPDTRPRPAHQPRTTRPQPAPASRPRLPRRPDRPRPAGIPRRLTPPAAITRSNHEPACACHQPSHTPQLDSKFKIPAGKDNLPDAIAAATDHWQPGTAANSAGTGQGRSPLGSPVNPVTSRPAQRGRVADYAPDASFATRTRPTTGEPNFEEGFQAAAPEAELTDERDNRRSAHPDPKIPIHLGSTVISAKWPGSFSGDRTPVRRSPEKPTSWPCRR